MGFFPKFRGFLGTYLAQHYVTSSSLKFVFSWEIYNMKIQHELELWTKYDLKVNFIIKKPIKYLFYISWETPRCPNMKQCESKTLSRIDGYSKEAQYLKIITFCGSSLLISQIKHTHVLKTNMTTCYSFPISVKSNSNLKW